LAGFRDRTAAATVAVIFAKQLAADLRCLETAARPALAIEVVAENAQCIHREAVFDCRPAGPEPQGGLAPYGAVAA
jgi:hypothetical protein